MKNWAKFLFYEIRKVATCAPHKTANLLQHDAELKTTLISTEELLVLGLVNNHLFLQKKNESPIFPDQISTFFRQKETQLSLPTSAESAVRFLNGTPLETGEKLKLQFLFLQPPSSAPPPPNTGAPFFSLREAQFSIFSQKSVCLS